MEQLAAAVLWGGQGSRRIFLEKWGHCTSAWACGSCPVQGPSGTPQHGCLCVPYHTAGYSADSPPVCLSRRSRCRTQQPRASQRARPLEGRCKPASEKTSQWLNARMPAHAHACAHPCTQAHARTRMRTPMHAGPHMHTHAHTCARARTQAHACAHSQPDRFTKLCQRSRGESSGVSRAPQDGETVLHAPHHRRAAAWL